MALHSDYSKTPLRWGVLLYPGFEALDVFGPLEALNMLYRQSPLQEPLAIIGNADSLEPISTAPPPTAKGYNLKCAQSVVPTHSIKDLVDGKVELDVLIVPGGPGAREEVRPGTEREIELLRTVYPRLQYLITVCTGSLLAAKAGILDGHTATTNKNAWAAVNASGPRTKWKARARWVVSGNIWTSAGVSAGIDATLAFIEHIYGHEKALGVAKGMEYYWNSDPDADKFAGNISDVN